MRSFVRGLIALLMMGGLLVWGGVAFAQSVSLTAGTYVVHQGQTMRGNIRIDAGTVDVRGTLDGNIFVKVGTVTVSGLVDGNVSVGTGTIDVTSGGRITGSRTVGFGEAGVGPSMFLGGPVTVHWMGGSFLGWGFSSVLKLIANLVITGLLITLFPGAMSRVAEDIERKPIEAAGLGCMGNVGFLIAILGFTVIIIGIPIAILLGIAWFLLMIFANAALIWWIGRRVGQTAWPAKSLHPYQELLIGTLVLTCAEIIPVVGWIAAVFLGLVGFGAVLRTRLGTNQSWWPL